MFSVLIVDDLEVLRYDLKRMSIWESAGFFIKGEAENGLEALKKLKASLYDLVITDIKMPIMDGIELLKEISDTKLSPCVVLLSDYMEYIYAREGLVHGAFDYLGKPVDTTKLSELLTRVRIFLDEKKLEEERLKHLEGLAEEAFFPYQDVEKVAAFIIQGDQQAVEAAGQMIDSVGAALNYDSNKALIILKNVLDSIFARVLAQHGWMSLYTDLSTFKQLEIHENQDWQKIRNDIIQIINNIISFLHKFIVWKDNDTIMKEVCLEVLYHIEDDISVKSIAEKLFISKTYLSEKFKQSTEVPLLKYITLVKMERAKFLFKASSYKNYEIAEMLGYDDNEYFSTVFKKITGVAPNVYRKEN